MASHFRVHIHLGAHKTATTFIQNWLGRHYEFLQENQIAYIPLSTLRKQFTPCFWELANGKADNPAAAVQKIRAILEADIVASGFDLEKTRLLVLSEENLLGSLASLSNKGELYPGLAGRMVHLAAIFAGCEVQTFMSIRNFREFYPSAYAETLRHGPIKPFDRYLEQLNIMGNSWLDTVDAIESELGTLKLWPYEQFRRFAPDILSALLAVPVGAQMIGSDSVVRPSLTRKGLDVVMRCQELLTPQETKRLVNLLVEKMVFEGPDGRICIDDADMNAQLDAQYADEWAKLAQRFVVDDAGCASPPLR